MVQKFTDKLHRLCDEASESLAHLIINHAEYNERAGCNAIMMNSDYGYTLDGSGKPVMIDGDGYTYDLWNNEIIDIMNDIDELEMKYENKTK